MAKKEIVIYHGSVSVISQPKYGKGKTHNDYGLGFYCTENLHLAKEWAVDENRDGYANKYILNLEGLSLLDLSNKNVLYWLSTLLQNRTFNSKSDIAKIGKDFLIHNYSLPINEYDIITGYRADDSYFSYAENFLNNIISVQRLSEALQFGNLGKQIVLKTKKAFSQIRFFGYEKADAETYYSLRQERNVDARNKFLLNKQGVPTQNDLYLSDIMKGVSNHDPRLQ